MLFLSAGVKIDKNPAFDPLVKGRKIGDNLDASTRMYALINQSGRIGSRMPKHAHTHTHTHTLTT